MIPPNVTSIGAFAFFDCTDMTHVTIPDSVTSIGYEAFRDCTGLTSVMIGSGVTSIDDYVFLGCSDMDSVTIPDNVTSIGDYAFFDSNSSMTIKGKTGSYAAVYAKNNRLRFEAVILPVSNKSALSSDSIILGQSITVNCAAKEGTSPYTYAVYYRKAGTDKWTAVQGLSCIKNPLHRSGWHWQSTAQTTFLY